MKKLTFTEAKTHELRQAHRATKNKKDADKIKAVYGSVVGDDGKNVGQKMTLSLVFGSL